MPPRRRTRPAPPDVDALRTALEAGKIVRVGIIPSDQFPEGLTGRVRRIGDPAQDGEEYLFVEVSVGGAKDVLPFAPGDLTGTPARKQPAPVAATTVRPAGSPGPVALFAATASAPTARTAPAARTPVAEAAASSGPDRATPTPTPVVDSGTAGSAPSTRRATGVAARAKRPPVTITISTAGDETATWRVEARIGARIAVRPTPVPPSRVWEIVESLGEPRLAAVVQTLLDEHRRSTQARADALAAELAALQSELSSYPAADG